MTAAIDRERLAAVQAAELAAFEARTPRSAALRERASRSMIKGVPMSWMSGLYRHPPLFVERGSGATFWDVDGNRYTDFNVVDLALTTGFDAPPVTRAVTAAMQRGAHFLLPIEAAIEVSESLAARVGMPFWQFTLSASGANSEVLRIARSMTGRRGLLLFAGHYHGHLDETLVEAQDGRVVPAMEGLPADIADHVQIVPFNDLEAAERALSSGEVALCLTEPALTNCTLVHPAKGYLESLHALCRAHGTLLCIDEAHTFQFAYGGLTRAWRLPADCVVLGKGLGTGVPFGLYGMSAEVAAHVEAHTHVDMGPKGLAAGGTTYANTLAVMAAKAALEEVLTPANYERVAGLGARLAGGLQRVFDEAGLPWTALCLGPRSGYCLFSNPPRDGEDAQRSIDPAFIGARRLWMANRGVWDAIASAGPQVSFSHSARDVDDYVALAAGFVAAVVASR